MSPFAPQAYNILLQTLLMSITPALPAGAPGTRLPVGSPETIPDFTFITRELKLGDGIEPKEITRLNGYIRQAIAYHRDLYKLLPVHIVDSIESILDHFNGANGPIGRIRIVSHGSDSYLFVPLFHGGNWDFGISEELLKAFQSRDDDGLRFILTRIPDQSPTLVGSSKEIVAGIRALPNGAALLAPFGLSGGGFPPPGDVKLYFDVVADLYQVTHGTIRAGGFPPPPALSPLNASQKTTLTASLNLIEKAIRARLIGKVVDGKTPLNEKQMKDLRDGVLAATPAQLKLPIEIIDMDVLFFQDLSTANRALTVTGTNIGFRAKLEYLRSIMGSASAVDIRGCLIGKTPKYLDILRDFLGSAANSPTVSAPDWFQSFPTGGIHYSFGGKMFSSIDNLVKNGSPPGITPSDVQSSFDTWKGLIDFDAHFDFIKFVFASSLFHFATLEWRVWKIGGVNFGIPVLRMEAKRIDDIVSRDLGDIVERFGVIFEISAGSMPNPAVRAKLNKLRPILITFKTISDGIVASNNKASFVKPLTDLATKIVDIKLLPAPDPKKPLPPVSTSDLDIINSIERIEKHIDALLTANLEPFLKSVQSRLDGSNPTAEIRYYYNIGLPLLLQSSATPEITRVSAFSSEPALIASAFRSWMKIQWAGTTTAQVTAMNTRINSIPLGNDPQRKIALQASRLAEREDPSAAAVLNPMPSFGNHIIVSRP